MAESDFGEGKILTVFLTLPRSIELALDDLNDRLDRLAVDDPKRPEIVRQIRLLQDALDARQPL